MDLESRYMLLSNGILLGSYAVLSTLMISRTLHCPCFHHSQCPIEPGYPCLCLSGCPSLSSCDLRFDQPVPFVFVCVPIQQELHHQWHEANSHPQRLSLISWTVVTYYLCWLHTHIYDHICWNLRFLRFRETEKNYQLWKEKIKYITFQKKNPGSDIAIWRPLGVWSLRPCWSRDNDVSRHRGRTTWCASGEVQSHELVLCTHEARNHLQVLQAVAQSDRDCCHLTMTALILPCQHFQGERFDNPLTLLSLSCTWMWPLSLLPYQRSKFEPKYVNIVKPYQSVRRLTCNMMQSAYIYNIIHTPTLEK